MKCDVAVIGGGVAGCTSAIELKRLGVASVVLVDSGDRPPPVGESIPPDSSMLLEQLGVMSRFHEDGHEPGLGSCSAWGSTDLGYNDFALSAHGPGWHLDRPRFDRLFGDRARDVGAVLLRGRAGSVCVTGNGRGTVRVGNRTLEPFVIVDATGAGAAVSRRLGASRHVHDRLSCIAGFFELGGRGDLGGLTMLEATPEGWWYAARLPGDRAVAVCAVEKSQFGPLDDDLERRWAARLRATEHIGKALDGATLIRGSVAMRSAPSAITTPCSGPGWFAAGDAAAAFDPIASRGLHQAMSGGMDVARAVVATLGGSRAAPAEYDSAVRSMFDGYLADRQYLYDLERRWPTAPFWSHRHAKSQIEADAIR